MTEAVRRHLDALAAWKRLRPEWDEEFDGDPAAEDRNEWDR